MSGTFPVGQAPSSAVLRSIQPTRTSVSHSLKRQTRTRGAQRWGMQFSWDSINRDMFAPLQAFSMAQQGQSGTFTVTVPGYTVPQGTWSGSPVVNGAGNVGQTVVIRGLAASQPAAAKAGDVIKFSGHTKVYMVTADAASDGSGSSTLTIIPALVAAVSDGEALTVSNVPFRVSLAGDSLEASLRLGIQYGLQVDFVEDF